MHHPCQSAEDYARLFQKCDSEQKKVPLELAAVPSVSSVVAPNSSNGNVVNDDVAVQPPVANDANVANDRHNGTTESSLVTRERQDTFILKANRKGSFGLSFELRSNSVFVQIHTANKSFKHSPELLECFSNSIAVQLISVDDGSILHTNFPNTTRAKLILDQLAKDDKNPQVVLRSFIVVSLPTTNGNNE